MITLSVSIIAHNEEKQLNECLESVRGVADEIIVVDCESSDKTRETAYKYTDRVYSRPNLMNLNVNKQFGVEQCTKDWVFYIDPDEKLSEVLRKKIKKILCNDKINGYLLPRKNYFLGQWLRYGSQYPDWQLRLFKRGKATFPAEHVHERIRVKGKIKKIFTGHIIHNPYPDASTLLKKLDFYTSFQSQFLRKCQIDLNFMVIIIRAVLRFIKRYLLKMGFLDGYRGFIACWYDTATAIITYAKYKMK